MSELQSDAPLPPVQFTVESRYDTLTTFRQPYLKRGWDCSELSIPSILPRHGHHSSASLPVPFQNIGARGLNNITSKMVMTLFPPNQAFFKLAMDESVIREIEEKHGADSTEAKNLTTEFNKAFATMERIFLADMEASADRTVLYEALQHIFCTGNALVHHSKEGLRVFHLDQFVVRRDPAGHVLEIILKEEVDPIVLPEAIRVKFRTNPDYANKKSACLYTYIVRGANEWTTYQEAVGAKIAETHGTYPLDACPWHALRFKRINGEDYGRSYVEEYMGDLTSLENLTAAIVQGSAAAAKVLFLVKPNSSTKIQVLAKTPNGGFGSGNAEDVTVLHLDKAQDFATAKALRDDLIQQLSYAFLLHSSIQRDAERVTAEEIRYMAQELESALGGFYSLSSVELQLPYVKVKLANLQRKRKLPRLPKGTVRPTIVTGLSGLGRGNDRTNLVSFVKTSFEAVTPQIAARYFNVSEILDRLAISFGIDQKNLLKTPKQIAQEDQAAQQQAMMQQLGPNVVNALGGAAKERIKSNGQQGPSTEGQ